MFVCTKFALPPITLLLPDDAGKVVPKFIRKLLEPLIKIELVTFEIPVGPNKAPPGINPKLTSSLSKDVVIAFR